MSACVISATSLYLISKRSPFDKAGKISAGHPAPASRKNPRTREVHTAKAPLVRNVINQQYAHRASVVSCRDCPESLLPCGVPYLQLDALAVKVYGADFEVDSYGRNEGGSETVFGEAEQAARLAHAGVTYQEKFDLTRARQC